MIRRFVFMVFFAGWVLSALTVNADDKAEAKKRFKAGLAMMKSGDFGGAAEPLTIMSGPHEVALRCAPGEWIIRK